MNNPKIFFQSSLPRTGSTLLQNLLGQNPEIYVTPTSGMGPLIRESFLHFGDSLEFKNLGLEKYLPAFHNFCKGGLKEYYKTLTNKPYIIDKNGTWYDSYFNLKKIYPNLKIICLIRDLRGIISSFEKWHRKNSHRLFPHYNEKLHLTLDSRYEVYTKSDYTPLEPILSSLKNLIQINELQNIYILKYEDLCYNPLNTIKGIYNFLEIPYFNHNFNNITQITEENDNFITFGEHTIFSQIKNPDNNWEEILGKEICERIYNDYQWYFNFFQYKK